MLRRSGFALAALLIAGCAPATNDGPGPGNVFRDLADPPVLEPVIEADESEVAGITQAELAPGERYSFPIRVSLGRSDFYALQVQPDFNCLAATIAVTQGRRIWQKTTPDCATEFHIRPLVDGPAEVTVQVDACRIELCFVGLLYSRESAFRPFPVIDLDPPVYSEADLLDRAYALAVAEMEFERPDVPTEILLTERGEIRTREMNVVTFEADPGRSYRVDVFSTASCHDMIATASAGVITWRERTPACDITFDLNRSLEGTVTIVIVINACRRDSCPWGVLVTGAPSAAPGPITSR